VRELYCIAKTLGQIWTKAFPLSFSRE